MIKSFELPFQFDADRLRADLDQISSNEWRSHFNTAIYEGERSGGRFTFCRWYFKPNIP